LSVGLIALYTRLWLLGVFRMLGVERERGARAKCNAGCSND
jgi:hypothetical protein